MRKWNLEEWNLRGNEYARSKLSISKFFLNLNYNNFLSPSKSLIVKNEREKTKILILIKFYNRRN